MRMDRNENPDGCGKYAVVNLRRLNALCGVGENSRQWPTDIAAAMRTLEKAGVLEWGAMGQPDEFFLVKLKDKHAQAALGAYARSVSEEDPEFGREVTALASRSGPDHPLCKAPD